MIKGNHFTKILTVAGIAILSLTGITPANAAESIPANCTVVGDAGNNLLYGTDANDIICGLGGNDIIYGLGGDDALYGGSGDDYLSGGDGLDGGYGGAGNDFIYGNGDDDSLYGGAGSDSLNGGDGYDTIRGEDGVDTCVDFSTDNFLKADCFYDHSVPVLRKVSFSKPNPTVDVTLGQTRLKLQFTVADLGAGLKSIGFSFSPKNTKGGAGLVGTVFESVDVACSAELTENCRLSGTPNLGTYTATMILPANTAKSVYVLDEVNVSDTVGNSSLIEAKALAKNKLQLSFTQTGAPDRKAPYLTGASIIGTSTLANPFSSIIARFSFKDAKGDDFKQGMFEFSAPDSGVRPTPSFVQFAIPSGHVDCSTPHNLDVACLYSGTWSDGVIEFAIGIPTTKENLRDFYASQKLVPSEYTFTDSAGNQSNHTFPKPLVSAFSFTKGWATPAVIDNDKTPPTLVDMSVDRSSVNTGSSAQTITLTFRLKDVGVGVYMKADGMSNMPAVAIEGTKHLIAYWCDIFGDAVGQPTDATFKFTCVLPAHAPKDTYRFSIAAYDESKRTNLGSFLAPWISKQKFAVRVKNG